MIRYRGLSVIALSAVLCSCSPVGTRDKTADATVSDELSFFSDTLRSHDRREVEIELAAAITQYPYESKDVVRQQTAALLAAADGDSVAFGLVTDIMERYLAEPNSPMRNEEHYIIYLEELLRLPGLTEAERMRPAYRLETARKNRPGSQATDFAYIDRHGMRRTLYSTPGRYLLLIFYDPECGHCSDILGQVSESAVLKECMARKSLTVLAVYTEGKRRLWEATKASMPREWRVGFDTDSIVDRELYSIPAMPVMYLLDNDKNVLLKDAYLPEIEERLNGLP